MNIEDRIQASIETKKRMLEDKALLNKVMEAAEAMAGCYKNGGKVLWCGNGGSAADAQHLAAELSGRFYVDRDPLASEALHANTSYLTAVANDYSFDVVYSRLVKAVGKPGDVLVGISTSGNSANIVNALAAAREIGMVTIGLTGEKPSKMDALSSILIKIPSTDTPRIQESHILLGHTMCEMVESALFPKS